MTTKLEYIMNGILGVVVGVSAGLGIQIINILSTKYNFYRESKNIVDFLETSKNSTDFNFRSTTIICNAVNLPEERVRYICNRSKKIQRNETVKETWRLKE